MIHAFFYPPEYGSSDLNKQRRIRLGISIALVFIGLLLVFQPLYLIFLDSTGAGLLALPGIVLFAALLFLLRSGRISFAVYSNVLIGVSVVVHTINTCTTGGPVSIFLAGYIDMQIMTALLVGRRNAYIWIAIQILVPFALGALELQGVRLPYTRLDAGSPRLQLLLSVAITIGAGFFVVLMKTSLDSALELLQRRNEELAIAHQHQIRAEKLAADLEQQRHMEALRQRIARDLHDDIGSALSAINIYSSIAEQQSSETSLPLLKKITDSSGKLLDAMGDIVWSVNHSNDELEVLLNKMNEHANAVLAARQIAVSFRVDGPTPEHAIPAASRKDVYLIYKEAVNNILKHAEASRVEISLSTYRDGVLLEVTDNGAGFAPDSTGSERNGLKNMMARAAAIDANLQITSSPGNGTRLRLALPGGAEAGPTR